MKKSYDAKIASISFEIGFLDKKIIDLIYTMP